MHPYQRMERGPLTMGKTWKKSDSDFVFIEGEVELYPQYKKRLAEMIDDIIHSTPSFENIGGGKTNIPSRPTENKVYSLLDDIRIKKLRITIDAIEFAYSELDQEKKLFVERLFWNHLSLTEVCDEFAISPATANRWRRAFLLRVGLLTGDKREPDLGRGDNRERPDTQPFHITLDESGRSSEVR